MKKITLPLIFLLILTLTVLPVLGAEEIKPDEKGSITVVFRSSSPDNAVRNSDGVAVYAWKIADVSGTGDSVKYAPLPGFEDLNFIITEASAWDQVARDAWEVIRVDHDLRVNAVVSGFLSNGSITFEDLDTGLYLLRFLTFFVQINLSLAIFNLLPIPPLDGYHVVNDIFLRGKLHIPAKAINLAMMVLLFLFMFTNIFSKAISKAVYFVQGGVVNGLLAIFGLR